MPVVELQGERELLVTVAVYGSLGYRRRDSSTYRLYEVAGMSHVNNEPDIDFPAVNVSISQPGAAPTEIETQITQKVEAAARSVNGVDEIQSTASEGNARASS